MQCEECKYWIPLSENYGEGEPIKTPNGKKIGWCRRRPPSTQRMPDAHTQFGWPETLNSHRCGEFEPEKTELERLQARMFEWQDTCYSEQNHNVMLRKQLAEFRAWFLKVTLPLNGCTKRTSTKKLQRIIEDKLAIKD